MDTGFRTPLLDFFRRGDVARDVRLLAAQGALAPRAHEQLGLLVRIIATTRAWIKNFRRSPRSPRTPRRRWRCR